VLLADDDADWLACLRRDLIRDHRVVACSDGVSALAAIAGGAFDAVVADLCMPPPDGFSILRACRDLAPPPPVIVVSGMDSTRGTLEALQLGARDYLMKPVTVAMVRAALDRAIADPGGAEGSRLTGRSPAMVRLRRLIPLLAGSDEAVLITGEPAPARSCWRANCTSVRGGAPDRS
jgi:DNA-binding NtrC family response regulator